MGRSRPDKKIVGRMNRGIKGKICASVLAMLDNIMPRAMEISDKIHITANRESMMFMVYESVNKIYTSNMMSTAWSVARPA